MLRAIARRQRRELVFADPRPVLADLWRRSYDLALARYGPVVSLMLVLLIVLWAIGEHAQRRVVVQDVETQRYIEQFTAGPVAEARERLNRGLHQERVRRAILRFRTVAVPNHAVSHETRLADDIETVLRFYRRLGLCIRMASCDPAAAAAWFGDLPWRFRDRHQLYLKAAYPDEDLDALFSTISPRPGMEPKPGAGSSERIR